MNRAEPMADARWKPLLAIGCVLLAASCAALRGRSAVAPAPSPEAGRGAPVKAEKRLPDRVSEVMMISWAEPAPMGCEADLEGTAKPAYFRLRYTEAGREPVAVDTDPDKLFAEQWEIVTRSARGLGFVKRAELTALGFDIAEELRCQCESGSRKGAKSAAQNHLINVKLEWKSGGKPEVSGRMQKDGSWEVVEPVTINGRLATWDFHFVRPDPGSGRGECSSRFRLVLGLDAPLE